jgi:hypothetical protein
MFDNSNKARRDSFIFHARMNLRYHEGMEWMCELCLNWTLFFSFVLASASFLALTGSLPFVSQESGQWAACLLAFAVAALNGMVLVFGVTARLGRHRELKLNWMHLLAQAEETGVDFAFLEGEVPDLNDLELLPADPI